MNKRTDTDLNELLSKGSLSELKRLEIGTRRKIDSSLMGNYRSAFRGSGLVFADLREYQPGDEVRDIHWKATARSQKTFVKAYEEDRQLNFCLMLDISLSTDFGQPRTRHRRALELGALVTMLARQNSDAVGLCLFADTVKKYYKPLRGRKATQRVLYDLLSAQPEGAGTAIEKAIEHVMIHQPRNSVVFLISDFLNKQDFGQDLRKLAFRHDVICVFLGTQSGLELPRTGILRLRDSETGQVFDFDSSSERARKKLLERNRERIDSARRTCRSAGADFITLESSPLETLSRLALRRVSRMR